MAWTGLKLTTAGRNALNQAQVSQKLNFKSIVIGDGEPPSNFSTRTELVHQLYEITNLKIDVTDTGCTLTADFLKTDYDYYFREIGIIVITEDGEKLYVYDNCGEDAQLFVYTTETEETKKRLRLSLEISDVAEITVSNPSILYVAYDDYEKTITEIKQKKLSVDGDGADVVVTFEDTKELKTLSSGEKLSTAFSKIKLTITNLISHLANKNNPHIVTKAQVGLGNVDNIADADKNVKYAISASTSAYAIKADTASYAVNSSTASYSSNGAKATSAISAAYASTAAKAGTATYAIKAKQDEGGNVITDTYATKSVVNTKPPLKEAPTYATLAEFWEAYTELTAGIGQCAFLRFKDSGGWTPSGGWYRAWVTSQNKLGNGSWDVSGSISLVNGSSFYIGSVTGGASDSSDLAVTWTQYVSNTGDILTGNLQISKSDPYLKLINTQGGSDILGLHYYGTSTGNNTFGIYDAAKEKHLLTIAQSTGDISAGVGKFVGNLIGNVTGKATSATYATTAIKAGTATYSTNSGTASRATYVGANTGNNGLSIRGYTGTASTAAAFIYLQEDFTNNCVNVGIDGLGGVGVQRAIFATKASSATSATYATTATKAGTATYATSSGSASKASSATSATYATTATKSGTSTYAAKAGTASYASNGAKASSATSATYASTANYAKAVANHTHSYLPLSGGTVTGATAVNAALSTNTSFAAYNTAKIYVCPTASLSNGSGYFYASGNNTYLTANNTSSNSYLQLQARSAIQCLATGSDNTWLGINAASFNEKSSKRYKENIKSMTKEEAMRILEVRAVSYDYKEGIMADETHRFGQHGVIVEEVEKVIPEVVSYAEIEELGKVPDTVAYSKFVPYLIKMIQIQQIEIEELKQKVA